MNVHKTFRRRPGRLLNVLCTFNLRPVSTGKYNLNFVKFGIQSRVNKLILNILFGIDDLVPKFGHITDVLSDFMKFGTKNKLNILIDIYCLDSFSL